jgi:sulfite reductase (ferredoxin)
MQNILITNVPNERTAELLERSRALGVALDGSPFQRGTASCTGSEYCKLALTETKLFSIRLAQELEDRLPGFTDIVKLHVAGCPNSCGQHPIADVGLQGVLLNQGGVQVEGFDFFVGGGLGKNSALGHRIGFRAAADEVPNALERLFEAFTSGKSDGETIRAWTGRLGDAGVKAILSGSAVAGPVA